MNRLARLKRLHEQQLRRQELAELAHAQSQSQRAKVRAELDRARSRWEQMADSAVHASVRAFEEGREYLAQAQREVRQKEAELTRAEGEVARTQEAVRHNSVESKKLETLHDATALAMRQEADRVEQRGFDELAARRARA